MPSPARIGSGGSGVSLSTLAKKECVQPACDHRDLNSHPGDFFGGPFSAVSTPILATKYSFCSIFRDLQDLHTFAPLQSQKFSKILQFFGDFIKISGILLKFCEIFQKFAKILAIFY